MQLLQAVQAVNHPSQANLQDECKQILRNYFYTCESSTVATEHPRRMQAAMNNKLKVGVDRPQGLWFRIVDKSGAKLRSPNVLAVTAWSLCPTGPQPLQKVFRSLSTYNTQNP